MNNEIKPISIRHEQIGVSILKTLLGNIPIVGTALTESLIDYWGRVKQERLNNFTEKLKEYFETVSENEIDEEFIRSEDFAGYFELVLKRVSETKSDSAKLERFKSILVKNMRTAEIPDFSELFLALVSQLTEKQMAILKVVYDFQYDEVSYAKSLSDLNSEIESTDSLARYEVTAPKSGSFLNHYSGISLHTKSAELKEQKESMLSHLNELRMLRQSGYESLHGPIDNAYIQSLMSLGLLEYNKAFVRVICLENMKMTEYGEKFIDFIKSN